MFKKQLTVDNQELTIVLEVENLTGKPIIEMGYLGKGLRQTILSEELSTDFDNLVPNFIGKSAFDDDGHVIMTMMEQLKKVIESHIKHYKRILQADLGTYVAETIVFLDAYYEQILGKSFESEKKQTFNMYFNFYFKQLPPEWKQPN